MQYINRKMIEDGLMSKVIVPTLEDGELAARIGDCWFWFGGTEFKYTDPKEIPFNILVDKIKECLDDFYEHPDIFDNEYLYYYYYLCENI